MVIGLDFLQADAKPNSIATLEPLAEGGAVVRVSPVDVPQDVVRRA